MLNSPRAVPPNTPGKTNEREQTGGMYWLRLHPPGRPRFCRRPESLPGVFSSRKMIAGLLSIGPHLISDDSATEPNEEDPP